MSSERRLVSRSRDKKIRGVNLGGWLVLERWITPQLFEGTDAQDEYSFMQTHNAKKKIRNHQRDFITEADFKWLKDHNVNAVRIPIGYWALEGDDPYIACVGRLDWAFKMADRYDMKVCLSLHGAPGSQNGWDHSGRIGKAEWRERQVYRDRTLDVLKELAKRYRNYKSFWGLELLNEPFFWLRYFVVRKFYTQAYMQLQDILAPHTRIIFHDAFMPRLMSGVIGGGVRKAVMDIHWYHFNDKLVILPLWAYRVWMRLRKGLLHNLVAHQGVIVGEWSGVISHKKLRNMSEEKCNDIARRHIDDQVKIYQPADGWFYWTYKTQKDEVWSFRSVVERGWLEL